MPPPQNLPMLHVANGKATLNYLRNLKQLMNNGPTWWLLLF